MLKITRGWANWQTAKKLLICLGAFASFFVLYLWRLGNLTLGLSQHEAGARTASGSYHNLINNPVNAPHKILQYFWQTLDYHGAFWMRSVSILFFILFLASFYLLLKVWFGRFIAALGVVLFATTPWIIISARSAAPDVMWLSPIFFLFAFTHLCHTTKRVNLAWFIFILSLILSVYTPGVIWFIVFVFILKFKKIKPAVLKIKGHLVVGGLVLLILSILPLAYASFKHVSVGKELLLIPDNFIGGMALAKNIIWSFSGLVYKLPVHLDYTLGRLPLLNIAQVVLAAIGVYALWKKARSETLIILFLIVLAVLATAINTNRLFLTMTIPAVAVFDAAGLRHLYKKWFYVFPHNPFAKTFGVCIVALILVAHVLYGFRYAVLAWPHNQDTRKVYVIK